MDKISGQARCFTEDAEQYGEDIRQRMDAATWLADRGSGKPAPDRDSNAPGIGDFTIVIGDHDVRGNPIIEA